MIRVLSSWTVDGAAVSRIEGAPTRHRYLRHRRPGMSPAEKVRAMRARRRAAGLCARCENPSLEWYCRGCQDLEIERYLARSGHRQRRLQRCGACNGGGHNARRCPVGYSIGALA